jgi:hypothetical protein
MLTAVNSAQGRSDQFGLHQVSFCSLTTVHSQLLSYQLDFTTPGISPLSANARKHKRQMPNFRRYPRGRPQSLHRLCLRELNFGFRASFTLFAVVAINPQKQFTVLSS